MESFDTWWQDYEKKVRISSFSCKYDAAKGSAESAWKAVSGNFIAVEPTFCPDCGTPVDDSGYKEFGCWACGKRLILTKPLPIK